MNNILEHFIEGDSLEVLKSIVGKKISHGFVKPPLTFDLDLNEVECYGIAIQVDGVQGFLCILSDWKGDTAKFGLDCQVLRVSLETQPDFLRVDQVIRKGSQINKMTNSSGLKFFEGSRTIDRVEVYEFYESEEDETVKYDKAIVFYAGKNKIIFDVNNSIAGNMIITTSIEYLNNIKIACALRWFKSIEV